MDSISEPFVYYTYVVDNLLGSFCLGDELVTASNNISNPLIIQWAQNELWL